MNANIIQRERLLRAKAEWALVRDEDIEIFGIAIEDDVRRDQIRALVKQEIDQQIADIDSDLERLAATTRAMNVKADGGVLTERKP
jgi:hypothetical protein